MFNRVTEKVLKRLEYEKLLMTSGITPQRVKITLADLIEAGKTEPRVYKVLPALCFYKPTVIYHLKDDLQKFPEIKKGLKLLNKKGEKDIFGYEKNDLLKAAQNYKNYLESQKQTQKSLSLTLRLSPDDYARLKKLSNKLELNNISKTLLFLAKEREKEEDIAFARIVKERENEETIRINLDEI